MDKTHPPAVSVLAAALVAALAAPVAAGTPVPEGFEDLLHGQIEQLDVRMPGRSAGVMPVLVDLETVQFEAPLQVLQALGLSVHAQRALLPALSRPLLRNSHAACRHGQPSAGCGYVPPPEAVDGIAALYDESEGAVVLFFHPRWLPADTSTASRFHAPSNGSRNALLHQQVVNMSGDEAYQAFSAQGVGTLGVQQQAHVSVEWNYSRQQYRHYRSRDHFALDNLYYRHDLGRQHYLQAGRMDRRNLSSPQGGLFGFSMLPLDRFHGLRLGTTQAYLDAHAAVHSTPLGVLLARDARVDAYDGGRLLQSFHLQAGANTLDTRHFPFGSYLVTLRIHEDGVLVRSEQAPFEKAGDGTDGSVQWFLQGGRRLHDSAAYRPAKVGSSNVLAQAGLRAPLGRDVTATVGLAESAAATYGELRLDARYPLQSQDLRGSASVLRGNDGGHGEQYQLAYRRRAAWNVHHQRLRGVACGQRLRTYDSLDCVDSLTASVGLPVAGGNAYLGHTRRRTYSMGWYVPGVDSGDAAWLAVGPLPGPPRLRGPQSSRSLQASYNRTVQWQGFSVGVRIGVWQQHNEGRNEMARDRGALLTFNASRLRRAGMDRHLQDRVAMEIRSTPANSAEVQYGAGQTRRREAGNGLREWSADLRGDTAGRAAATLAGQRDDAAGRTGAVLARYQQRRGAEHSFSVNHASGLALSARGFYWGGQPGAESGLAVRVDDSDDLDLQGVAAEVQVAGQRRHRLDIGERRLLPVPAYQPHQAELHDASASGSQASIRVDGSGRAQSLFLRPGRVLHMPVPLEVTYTFIGTARDVAGLPLGGARILNAPVPSTGRNGGFVVELPRRDAMLYLLREHDLLQCPLEVRERRSGALLVGAVRCGPLGTAQLPPDIRQQVRVQRLLQEHAQLQPAPHTAAVGAGR